MSVRTLVKSIQDIMRKDTGVDGDALMALCDQLEAGLAGAEATRTRLLDALLHAAFEPAGELAEAAE